MSLINDMLRDLEQRRRHEQNVIPRAGLPVAVPGQGFHRRLLYGSLALVLVGAVSLIGGRLLLPSNQQVSGTSPSAAIHTAYDDHASVAVPANDATASADVGHSATEAVTAGRAGAEEREPDAMSMTESESLLRAMQITETEGKAEVVLGFSELPDYRIVPPEMPDEAFQVVLATTRLTREFIVPDLSGTLLGRVALQPRSDSLALVFDVKRHAELKTVSVNRAGTAQHQLILVFGQTEVIPEIARRQDSAAPPKSEPVRQKDSDAGPVPSPEPSQAAAQPLIGLTDTANPSPDAVPQVTKAQIRVPRPEQLYQQALSLQADGQNVAAVERLTRILELQPKFTAARLQLVELVKSSKPAHAGELLRAGLALNNTDVGLRKSYARMLLQQERPAEALALMREAPRPEVSQDLEYNALLAALLRETGSFAEAAGLYRQLLQQRSDQPLWWLGLALSEEQTGALDAAAAAYQQAFERPGLRSDLRQFVHSRLQLLSRGT